MKTNSFTIEGITKTATATSSSTCEHPMYDQPKRGGARPGAGAPRKPADQSAVVRFSLALPHAEAIEYKRLGATRWLRRMLEASLPSTEIEANQPTMGHHNEGD